MSDNVPEKEMLKKLKSLREDLCKKADALDTFAQRSRILDLLMTGVSAAGLIMGFFVGPLAPVGVWLGRVGLLGLLCLAFPLWEWYSLRQLKQDRKWGEMASILKDMERQNMENMEELKSIFKELEEAGIDLRERMEPTATGDSGDSETESEASKPSKIKYVANIVRKAFSAIKAKAKSVATFARKTYYELKNANKAELVVTAVRKVISYVKDNFADCVASLVRKLKSLGSFFEKFCSTSAADITDFAAEVVSKTGSAVATASPSSTVRELLKKFFKSPTNVLGVISLFGYAYTLVKVPKDLYNRKPSDEAVEMRKYADSIDRFITICEKMLESDHEE